MGVLITSSTITANCLRASNPVPGVNTLVLVCACAPNNENTNVLTVSFILIIPASVKEVLSLINVVQALDVSLLWRIYSTV